MGINFKSFCCLIFGFALLISCEQTKGSEALIVEHGKPEILPSPQTLEILESSFRIDSESTIFFDDSSKISAALLAEYFKKNTNLNLQFDSISKSNQKTSSISFLLDKKLDLNNEGYLLVVDKNQVLLSAKTAVGLYWATQTFVQIIEQYSDSLQTTIEIPSLKIRDEPRFQHRGLLLDVGRHFFEKEVIKKYIDLLSHYKMNVLHWHLTDDQGWRLMIDKYPKLSEISAWREEANGEKYGGYYSKEEIREIVQYASLKNVNIIPEIELPGHSQAALAAYPQLSCIGAPIKPANDWGVFKEVYCAGNDSTFVFLEDVLGEVLELFPSKYIHIGGDESPKFRWENCDKCQNRIEEEGLADEHELQSYFINRIEKYLNSKGRILIGWDEILEGGLSPNAIVQSWRGMGPGKEAALAKHQVIMSPTSHCYLDYDLKSIDLKKVYNFDPIPSTLSKEFHSYIIGGECNMWTEHVPNDSTLDSKVFPRLLALSEVLWVYPEERNFESFYKKVQSQYSYLASKDVQYGLEGEPLKIEIIKDNDNSRIALIPGFKELQLQYRVGPDKEYKNYESPLMMNFTEILEVRALKNGLVYGKVLSQPIFNHKGLKGFCTYQNTYSDWYTAGGNHGLINGLVGSEDFRDGNWQGFNGEDLEVIIDLKQTQEISDVVTHFYQYSNAWIFLPIEFKVYTSINGEDWLLQGHEILQDRSRERGKFKEIVSVLLNPRMEARYVKIFAKNKGPVPDWHEAAGSPAWIFVDEIIIK